jgi:ribosomal protein L12E/L44/L45/RPP1/RPP2
MDHTAYMEAAKKAASPDELKELAAAAGMELTDEKAKEYFDKLKGEGEPPSAEIAEENLAGVAGGSGRIPDKKNPATPLGLPDHPTNTIIF